MWEVCKFPLGVKLREALNTVVVAVHRPIGRSRFQIPALSLAIAPGKIRDYAKLVSLTATFFRIHHY